MSPPLFRPAPRPSRLELLSLVVMSLFYVGVGTTHFTRPAFFVAIVPPFVPFPLAAVYVSGVAEITLGAALLVPRLRALAAWGIVALLIAVFPANVYMWLADVAPLGVRPPPYFHAIRLPMQLVLVAWAVWHARRAGARTATRAEGHQLGGVSSSG